MCLDHIACSHQQNLGCNYTVSMPRHVKSEQPINQAKAMAEQHLPQRPQQTQGACSP